MFWQRFYDLCINAGSKPNPIGKEIGISSATITQWKQGTIPTGDSLAKIADFFNCSVDYLLGRTDNPSVGSSGGINQSNVNSDNSTVNINSSVQSKQSDDSLTSEFISAFNELDFDNKVKAMNYVSKLKNGK